MLSHILRRKAQVSISPAIDASANGRGDVEVVNESFADRPVTPMSGPTSGPKSGPATGPSSYLTSGPTAGPTSGPTAGATFSPFSVPITGPTDKATNESGEPRNEIRQKEINGNPHRKYSTFHVYA
ncbi:unnamed protein product [Cylindrotheca closterium]|uniref:Uncharacterized protein n=1 Tax=Cylindrotheca closterium TaxID=2856 RepID=A0AAD2PUU9_9STRA|nr:unnamed protein product [Cylindrotheca closterium]